MTSLKNGIAGLIWLSGTALILFGLIFNPFSQMWWAGYKFERDFQTNQVNAYVEKNHENLCRSYLNASLIERWTDSYYWDMGYCEKYR